MYLGKLVFSDIHEFIACPSVPGDQYYSVCEYCQDLLAGTVLTRISPVTMVREIREHAQKTLAQVPVLRSTEPQSEELWYTLDDLTALAMLGSYYADKIEAAVNLRLFCLLGQKAHQQQAVALLTTAARHWHSYAQKSKAMYRPQRLNRLMGRVDLEEFNEMTELDILLAKEGQSLAAGTELFRSKKTKQE